MYIAKQNGKTIQSWSQELHNKDAFRNEFHGPSKAQWVARAYGYAAKKRDLYTSQVKLPVINCIKKTYFY